MDSSISTSIARCCNDERYMQLQRSYNQSTILNVFGIERSETKHSAFLKWMFDCNSSHHLGSEPLKKLLAFLSCKKYNHIPDEYFTRFLTGDYKLIQSKIETEYPLHLLDPSTVSSNDQNDRIDLYIELDVISNNSEDLMDTKTLEIVLENKVFSKEGKNQTVTYWNALKNYCDQNPSRIPIALFLALDLDEKCECGDFEKICYQDLLDYVIEPLTYYDLSPVTRWVFEDYIRNLEKPSDSEGKLKRCTIMATSKARRKMLKDIYSEHKKLFNTTLNCLYGKDTLMLIGDVDSMYEDDSPDNSLNSFGETHLWLLEPLVNVLADEQIEKMPERKKEFKSAMDRMLGYSSRTNEKYTISFLGKEGKTIISKPMAKSLASLYIFRAYLELNPKATLEELREKFPIELNPYYEKKYYSYLFYKDEEAFIYDKGEDYKGKENIGGWDFYRDYINVLKLDDGTIVRSIKMWRQDGFEKLITKAQKYGIIVKKITIKN